MLSPAVQEPTPLRSTPTCASLCALSDDEDEASGRTKPKRCGNAKRKATPIATKDRNKHKSKRVRQNDVSTCSPAVAVAQDREEALLARQVAYFAELDRESLCVHTRTRTGISMSQLGVA